jgi:hypothetical protein
MFAGRLGLGGVDDGGDLERAAPGVGCELERAQV